MRNTTKNIQTRINNHYNKYVSDDCIYSTIVNSIIGILLLYYCFMAIFTIVSTQHVIYENGNIECNTSLLYMLICMTVVVTVGFYISMVHFSVKQTNYCFAVCLLFVLAILGVYSLLFMELSDKCAVDNQYFKYSSDLYTISWVWIYMVSFTIFVSFITVAAYIILDTGNEVKEIEEEMSETHEL